MSDQGELHDDPTFGKAPIPLIHNLDITDGAVRLYTHMHWRYGQNKRNFEGQQSIAAYLGISRTTVSNRIDELAAHDWITVVYRGRNPKTGNFTTPYYHVFGSQEKCIHWRETYVPAPGETVAPKPEARKRISRKGKGGKVENLRHANLSSHGGANSGSDGAANLSSHDPANLSSDYPDSSHPDSIKTDTNKDNAATPLKLIEPSKKKERKPNSNQPLYEALVLAFGFKPEQMTQAAAGPFRSAAKDLIKVEFAADRIPALYDYVDGRRHKEGWKSFSAMALSKYLPDFLKWEAVQQRRKAEQDWENGVGKTPITEEQQKEMEAIFAELDEQFSGKKVSA